MVGCLGSLLGLVMFAGICAIIGGIVKAVTDIDLMFWITSIGLFLLGLPGLLISEFFSGIGDIFNDVQDRADLRQMEADFAADERMERYLDKLDEIKGGYNEYDDDYDEFKDELDDDYDDDFDDDDDDDSGIF